MDCGARPRPLSWVTIERDRDEAKERVEKEIEREMRGVRNGTKLFWGLQGTKIPSIAKTRWLTHPTSHVWIPGPIGARSLPPLSRETETRQERERSNREREREKRGREGCKTGLNYFRGCKAPRSSLLPKEGD